MPSATAAHSKPVNIRIREDVRLLIDRAAKSQGKSRSDFMIDAARRAAEDALLDQTLITVNEAEFDRFLDIFASPPDAMGLNKLMNAKRR